MKIKIRGFLKSSNEWIDGIGFIEEISKLISFSNDNINLVTVDKDSVQLWTGLVDKLMIAIYENDILYNNKSKKIYIVIYYGSAFRLLEYNFFNIKRLSNENPAVSLDDTRKFSNIMGSMSDSMTAKDYQVIGNHYFSEMTERFIHYRIFNEDWMMSDNKNIKLK